MQSLWCCSSSREYEQMPVDGLQRQGSQPGPREPESMVKLRKVIDPLEVSIIETGGKLTEKQMAKIFLNLKGGDGTNQADELTREDMKSFVRLLWDLQGENKSIVDNFNAMFTKMDTDGNKTISKQEFLDGLPQVIHQAQADKLHRQSEKRLSKRAFGKKSKNISAQHIEVLFDVLDTDKNKSLSTTELESITGLLCPRRCMGKKVKVGQEEQDPKDFAFKTLDKDGDGKITKSEFGTRAAYVLDAICASNQSAPMPKNPEQTMAVACFAIDGRLSEPVKEKLWKAFNVDNDDCLSKEEIAPLVYYLWEHLDEDREVIDVFRSLDENGDGKITKSEFMSAADKTFTMAAVAWPRPTPPEVVASMRLYEEDLCMQGECCARILSVCAQERTAPQMVALFIAHGAIEALVSAMDVAEKRKAIDVVETCCQALDVLLGKTDEKHDAVSRLIKATTGTDDTQTTLPQTVRKVLEMEGAPGKFQLAQAAVRVLGAVALCYPEQIKSEEVEQIARDAAEKYQTAAEQEARENRRKIEHASRALSEKSLSPETKDNE